MADATLGNAFFNSRGPYLEMGGWFAAQQLMRTCKRWQAVGQCWCENQEALMIRAGGGWDRCELRAGVMSAIARSSPKVRSLHLEGFNGAAFSAMDLVAPPVEELTLSLSTDVCGVLECTPLPKLKRLTITNCRDVAGDGLRYLAEQSLELDVLHLAQASL